MTGEVSRLVLEDNVQQARALTLDSRRSAAGYDDFLFVLDHMRVTGAADRGSGLPSREELAASAERQRGFPRPVLAVMMALAKNWGFVELLKAAVVDSARAEPFLPRYFPQPIRERFADRLAAHPLRREIVATAIINHIVNHAGISLIPRLMVATGKDAGSIAAAYLEAEEAGGVAAVREQVFAAAGDIAREHEMLLQIEQALELATRDLLQTGARPVPISWDTVRAALSTSS